MNDNLIYAMIAILNALAAGALLMAISLKDKQTWVSLALLAGNVVFLGWNLAQIKG